MPDARLAELILGLLTSRERANSIVGDLMEDAAFGGALKFWAQVARAGLSLLWRDICAAPFRAGVRLSGLALQIVPAAALVAIFCLLFLAFFKLTGGLIMGPGHIPY